MSTEPNTGPQLVFTLNPYARLLNIISGNPEQITVTGKFDIAPNAIINPATRTREKSEQLALIAEGYGLPVTVRSLVLDVPSYQSPPEEDGSYLQHATAKAVRGCHSLQEAGIDLLDRISVGEDSGIELNDTTLRDEPEFQRVSGLIAKIPRDMPFPGVETGPILQACGGAIGFFGLLGQIAERRRKAGGTMDTGVTMRSTIALARAENPTQTMTAVASVNANFITQPRPATGGIDIGNFIVPVGEKRSEAEMSTEYILNGVRARAFLALAQAGGLETGVAPVVKPAIHTSPHNCVGYIVDPETEFGQCVMRKARRQSNSVIIPVNITRGEQIQTDIVDRAQSFVVALDANPTGEAFYRDLYVSLALMVHQQTDDPSMAGKKICLVSDTGGSLLADRIYRHAHLRGQANPKPEQVYKAFVFVDDAIRFAHWAVEKYVAQPPYRFQTCELGVYAPQRLSVGVLTSANYEEESYLRETDELVTRLDSKRFDITTGAGAKGGMGRAAFKVEELRRLGSKIRQYGSSVQNMMDREGHVEGLMAFFEQARHRFRRIDSIFDMTHLPLLWQAGGAGSIEEAAAGLWMKHRSLHVPDDTHCQKLMGGKPFIIANGFGHFDVFEQAIPPQDFRELDIHVTRTALQTAEMAGALGKEIVRNNCAPALRALQQDILGGGKFLPLRVAEPA